MDGATEMLIGKSVLWGTVVLFAIMSAVFLSGKGAFLISGYNTAAKEAQAQYDEKKLCRVCGICCSLITLILAIFSFYVLDEPDSSSVTLMTAIFCIVIIVILIGMIVVANKLCKNKDAPSYYGGAEDPKKLEKMAKIAIPIVVLFWVTVLILILLHNGEIKFRFDEDAFYINAAPFSYDNILELEYTSDFDRGIKTNGTSNFTIKSGNYKNGEFGNYKLYSYTDCEEYIIVYTKETVVVVNDRDVSKTHVLYEDLLEKME